MFLSFSMYRSSGGQENVWGLGFCYRTVSEEIYLAQMGITCMGAKWFYPDGQLWDIAQTIRGIWLGVVFFLVTASTISTLPVSDPLLPNSDKDTISTSEVNSIWRNNKTFRIINTVHVIVIEFWRLKCDLDRFPQNLALCWVELRLIHQVELPHLEPTLK